MENKTSVLFIFIVVGALLILSLSSTALKDVEETEFPPPSPFFVKKGERKTTVKTEDGEISTVKISEGISNGWYHIEFITLEPNSIFLPVLLQSDMVFYVHTGSGQISWTDEDETKQLEIRRGDIYRLRPGTLFYIESSLEMERQKLRIYALFANSENDLHEPETGPYTSIRKLVLGFDRVVLEAAFGVSGEPMEEMVSSPDPDAIVHGLSNEKKNTVKLFEFMKGILGGNSYSSIFQSRSNKKKKNKAYNIFSNDPDFENCNGWSTVVSKKEVSALKGIDVSVFMVNLTKGSMMGPHWNPRASEIGIGLHGPGMVRVVCSSAAKQTGCKNMRFHIEEGDVFAVPRFHPMAQMAFNNDSFVFMGFSTSKKNNHPQYLAGTASVLQTLPRNILAISFGTTNTTMDQVLDKQKQAIILDCTSCAEEELRIMEEEIEKAKEEARKKEDEREKEEARKKEEEEKKREEEEKKKEEEEEEEAKRAQEEEARKEEEAREREAREREEEEEREKEEEARRAEEEEARKEEEARQREAREREEQEKEEEAERQKQQEEEAARRAEEEEARKEEQARQREAREREEQEKEEEGERQKQQEEEAARRAAEEETRKEEEARQREAREREEQEKEEEAERQKQQEEAARRAEEEARQREEKARAEEQQRREEEWAEEEEARREGEAMQREAKRREEAARQQEGGEGQPGREWGRRILKTLKA